MAIYNGTQKINMSGVAKVYVGTQLVYQSISVVSIALSGQTTTFNVGDTFAFGGTVTATYSNGSTADVTSSTTFSGYNMSVAGTYTVTASYTENGVNVTATYNITVNTAWTTLWSGSKKVGYGGSVTAGQTFNFGTVAYNAGLQFKITFTELVADKYSGGTPTYVPSDRTSPSTVTVTSSTKTTLLSVYSPYGAIYAKAYLEYRKSNGAVIGGYNNNDELARSHYVITKIEYK